MKFTFCLSLLLTGLLQVHCHHIPGHHEEQEHNGEQNPPEPQQQPPAEGQGTETTSYQKISDTNKDFALRLYKLIASDPAHKNVFFSPLSISTAFTLIALGAKNETHRQIFNGLGFNLSDTEENEIHEAFKIIVHTLNQPNNIAQVDMGNALFINESIPLLPKFQNDVQTLYEAEGFPTNFKNSTAAAAEINAYINKKTKGKIIQAVQELDDETVMVLVNYIFFKADWRRKFNPRSITEVDFFVDANTMVKVNMMYQEDYYDFLYDEDLSCWVVRVPYKRDYAAWFVLPDQGKLKDVEDALTRELFAKWRMSLKNDEIELHIPKFTISGSYDVKDLLQKLGVNDVFYDGADLSGISRRCKLKVSKVVHKAVLDVHEGGTEATAVIIAEFEPQYGHYIPIIKFDRPFLIFIGSKHMQHFIFIAKVMNPTAK